jgi:multidrug efflux pump subunit AcrA (membrane-fusion protein)
MNQSTKDITAKDIKKAVVSASLQRPLTLYPATIGLLGGFYAFMFGANPFALGAMVAGGTVTLANWVYEYFAKGDNHANQFVMRFRKELERRRTEALEHLEDELTDIHNDQAASQVKLFKSKYDNFHAILDRKLEMTELTYNRYLSIAEQVFLNGLDNLENAAIALKSISTIDEDRILNDIAKLTQENSSSSQHRTNELQTRLALRNEQLRRVNELLAINETALTQLDQVAAKIANIDTKQNRAHVDMEDAMDELRRLIYRVDEYSS